MKIIYTRDIPPHRFLMEVANDLRGTNDPEFHRLYELCSDIMNGDHTVGTFDSMVHNTFHDGVEIDTVIHWLMDSEDMIRKCVGIRKDR